MLPKTWRVIARNQSGSDATGVEVHADPWKFDNQGEVAYGAELALHPSATITNGTKSDGAEQDNSVGKYNGIKGTFRFATAGTTGNVELYIEWKDSSGVYPSDRASADIPANCTLLATIAGVAGARETNFTYE